MKPKVVVSAAVLFASLSSSAGAVVDDPNFTEVEVLHTSEPYAGLAWAPDGSNRLFMIKKEGLVQIFQDGALLAEPFANVSPIYTGSECGLVGIAFDPNFGQNGFVYFFVTVSVGEQQIVRYRALGNVGVEATPIVRGLPTNGLNHDGGAIGFGPDAKLYFAIGDLGGNVGVNDDLTSMAAKVGRVNRDGSDPGDNPFDDGAGPHDERIWARGFRNPFTMTFQPSTGALWLNVVGTSVEQIFSVARGDHGGYVQYEAFQPDGYITPKIAYITNGSTTYPIPTGGAVRSAGVTTFATTTPHWLHPGEEVTISGVSDPTFDGVAFVTRRVSDTTFTVAQSGADALSGGGTVSSPALGGCVTGGTFYDSTAASAEYRGNFFFGDLNSGLVMRARISGADVISVEPWASGHHDTVDIDVGPDGDLYHVSHNGPGGVFRERFNATRQGLVVSKAHLQMLEGGVAAFNVRLSMAPAAAVRVTVERESGDLDVSLTEGAELTFTQDDWSSPKPVRLGAAPDPDGNDDSAELRVQSAGLATERVSVRVIDEIRFQPPGDGGAGGQGGEPSGGGAGHATGGDPSGGSKGQGAAPGDGGTADGGEAGADVGTGGAGTPGTDDPGTTEGGHSDGGCGCSLHRTEGGGASALLLVLGLVLRRRATRISPRGTLARTNGSRT